jgi:hypothetical protein
MDDSRHKEIFALVYTVCHGRESLMGSLHKDPRKRSTVQQLLNMELVTGIHKNDDHEDDDDNDDEDEY